MALSKQDESSEIVNMEIEEPEEAARDGNGARDRRRASGGRGAGVGYLTLGEGSGVSFSNSPRTVERTHARTAKKSTNKRTKSHPQRTPYTTNPRPSLRIRRVIRNLRRDIDNGNGLLDMVNQEFMTSHCTSFISFYERVQDDADRETQARKDFVRQMDSCINLDIGGITLCMDCAAERPLHSCRFKKLRLEISDGSLVDISFPIYNAIAEMNFHNEYLPRRCRVTLSKEKCIHILVHMMPIFEKMIDLENQVWKIMGMRLEGGNRLPYWKESGDERELCDVCEGNILNMHPMCFQCGFVQCPKCFLAKWPNGGLPCLRGGVHQLVPVCIIPDILNSPLSTSRYVLRCLQSTMRKLGIHRMELDFYYTFHMQLFKPSITRANILRICGGKVMVIPASIIEQNVSLFHEYWRQSVPVIVENVRVDKDLWSSEWFYAHVPNTSREVADCIINCRTGEAVGDHENNGGITQAMFWRGYKDVSARLRGSDRRPMLLKLKDYPPDDTFKNVLPLHYVDFCKALPLKFYTLPHLQTGRSADGGHLNVALYIPDWFNKPDLGPKLYVAFGMLDAPEKSTTCLHLDIAGAVNLMCDVTIPQNSPDDIKGHLYDFLAVEGFKRGSPDWTRVVTNWKKAGALWTIWHPRDGDKLRNGIKKMVEIGLLRLPREYGSLSEISDPINEQCFYLGAVHRRYLEENFDVRGYTMIQMEGDLIFIPAGSPHQVQNLFSCIKAAEDFLTPEDIFMSDVVGDQFRRLGKDNLNHQDKLQLNNILYFTALETLSNLSRIEKESSISYRMRTK